MLKEQGLIGAGVFPVMQQKLQFTFWNKNSFKILKFEMWGIKVWIKKVKVLRTMYYRLNLS